LPFVGIDFLPKFGFLSHNFGSRNAIKPNKGSKDLNYSLISNKMLSQKIGSLCWRPGQKTSTNIGKPTPL